MGQSVKLSDDIMAHVRKEAALQSRSVAGQITHWIRIGRTIEKSKSFDYQRIVQALEADISPDDVSAEEQDVWFDQFATKMTEPSDQERTFHAERRQLGRGVGLSKAGDLVYAKTKSSKRS